MLAEVRGMHQEQRKTNQRLDRLEKQTQLNPAAITELPLSVMRLADKLEETVDLTQRGQRLENKVFG